MLIVNVTMESRLVLRFRFHLEVRGFGAGLDPREELVVALELTATLEGPQLLGDQIALLQDVCLSLVLSLRQGWWFRITVKVPLPLGALPLRALPCSFTSGGTASNPAASAYFRPDFGFAPDQEVFFLVLLNSGLSSVVSGL